MAAYDVIGVASADSDAASFREAVMRDNRVEGAEGTLVRPGKRDPRSRDRNAGGMLRVLRPTLSKLRLAVAVSQGCGVDVYDDLMKIAATAVRFTLQKRASPPQPRAPPACAHAPSSSLRRFHRADRAELDARACKRRRCRSIDAARQPGVKALGTYTIWYQMADLRVSISQAGPLPIKATAAIDGQPANFNAEIFSNGASTHRAVVPVGVPYTSPSVSTRSPSSRQRPTQSATRTTAST